MLNSKPEKKMLSTYIKLNLSLKRNKLYDFFYCNITRHILIFYNYYLNKIKSMEATLKMHSGEIRYMNSNCKATIGRIGKSEIKKRSLGKD